MESDSPPTPDQLRVDILSEPLPFIQKFRGKTIVVKYDGAAMKDASLQATVGISGKSEPPASGSGSSDGSNGHPYPEFDLDPDSPVDAYYSCDYFRIFEFKVRRCARGRSHDWTDCPFAHPGEKARRRDPRKFHYSGSACPDFRNGHCKKGDSCEFAHGVFECWLHPARYRTQPCEDGTSCERRLCFFAHTPEQLRVLPQLSPRGSNSVNSSMESYDGSPPMSPMTRLVSRSLGSSSVSEMVASLRKVKSLPTSWNVQVGSPGFVSPRWSMLRPAFCSLPSTPTRSTVGFLDFCDEGCEEEVPMERVESGRDLRAKMFERLREENSQEEGTGIGFGSPVSMGGTPVLPPVNERGRNLPDIDSASLPISNVEAGRIRRMLGLLAGIRRLESLIISMGGTPVIQTGNVEGSRIRRMLAGIGIASPISMGDTLVIQTGDVEAGHLLTGSRFGVGRSDITPMNDDFRMYIGNDEPQTGNYPPPLEISGDNSHLVRPLEQHLRSNCFVILFVTSEILGMVFETIYQESHIMPYFVIWIVCVTIVMYAARRLAMIEGGMANREQFAVYLRCFSFLLLELLQYWGIHQGNYVIALKIILKVTGAVIGWWVVGVLQSYMDAFGMHLPLRRRDD